MSDDMLGKARQELEALPPDLHGVAFDFLSKVGRDPAWAQGAKRFLRRENPFPRVRVHRPVIWPEKTFHDPEIASLPAVPEGEYWRNFRVGWNDNEDLYLASVEGYDWNKLCGETEAATAPCEVSSRFLPRYVYRKAFPENLGKDFTLGQILYLLRASDSDQLSDLGLNSYRQYFPVGSHVVWAHLVYEDYRYHWYVGYFKKSEKRTWESCQRILVIN